MARFDDRVEIAVLVKENKQLRAEIERLRAENERLDRIFTHVRLTDRLLAISDYEAAEAAERGE